MSKWGCLLVGWMMKTFYIDCRIQGVRGINKYYFDRLFWWENCSQP